jgi:septum formation protein
MLVLASGSPRRREILTAAGIEFVVRAGRVREEHRDGESPFAYVLRLAEEKARAVEAGADEIVLGADTVVVAGDEILEKPRDAADATRMLTLLSRSEHEVITGICLLQGDRVILDTASTRVRFVELSESAIASYVASGEPMDKAGAYAIQGQASKFIDRIEGDYFNVMGLPVALVYRHLGNTGFSL